MVLPGQYRRHNQQQLLLRGSHLETYPQHHQQQLYLSQHHWHYHQGSKVLAAGRMLQPQASNHQLEQPLVSCVDCRQSLPQQPVLCGTLFIGQMTIECSINAW